MKLIGWLLHWFGAVSIGVGLFMHFGPKLGRFLGRFKPQKLDNDYADTVGPRE